VELYNENARFLLHDTHATNMHSTVYAMTCNWPDSHPNIAVFFKLWSTDP